MKVSKNSEEISHYIQTYNFHTLFSFDILPYAELHSFQKSEKICNEGVDVPYLYYLISGKAKIYMSHKNGKTSLINFIQASSFIGELGLIGVESVTKTVEVIEDCMCLALPLKIVSIFCYKMLSFYRNYANLSVKKQLPEQKVMPKTIVIRSKID